MNRKGFTLIELLAIIVILAVIAVITVPIVLNIIEKSSEGAVRDSAYGYKDAINNFYISKLTQDKDYEFADKGYTVAELKILGVSVSGKEPIGNSWIKIQDNEVIQGCLQFDEYKVDIDDGKIGTVEKGECAKKEFDNPVIGLYEAQGEPGRLVYRGGDSQVNNYIVLKENGQDVMYRIVSYEEDDTIKVVRNEKLDSTMRWDTSAARKHSGNNYTFCPEYNGCNVWGNQSNTFYNGSSLSTGFFYKYYDSNTSSEMVSTTSGTVNSDASLNTYLNTEWLPTTGLSDYIENHEFNVGGVGSNVDIGFLKEKEEEKTLKWVGKVGLLNITEFVESSSNPSCVNVYNGQNSLGDVCVPCLQNNYNVKSYSQWTLSPRTDSASGNSGVWEAPVDNICFYSQIPNAKKGVRPVFYLKADTVLTGTGAADDAYRVVGME